MPFFNQRRGRNSRSVSLRLSGGTTHDVWDGLRNRRVLLKLLLVFVAIVAMIVSVQGWKLPFPYRLDQQPLHGIAAKIKFERVNRERTARDRERAAEQVPFIFRHAPQPLTELTNQLQTGLAQFAQAKSLLQLPPQTRAEFGLTPATGPAAAAAQKFNLAEEFEKLKKIAGDERQLPVVVKEFGEFVQPLEKKGLIRPQHFPPEMSSSDTLAISVQEGQHEAVSLSEIQLPQLLAPNGLLGGRWTNFPALAPIRPEIETWLAVRAPETLAYDSAATQAARQAARDSVQESHDVYNRGDLLVKPGETIDEPMLELLRAEYDQTEAQVTLEQRVLRVGTVFLLLTILAVLNGYYLIHHETRLVQNFGRLTIYLAVMVITVALSRALSYDPWRAEIGPVMATVMIFAIAYNQVLATLTTLSLSLILTLSTGADLSGFIILMSACTIAIILLPSVPSRSTLVVVGAWAAATYFLMFWGTGIIENQSNTNTWTDTIQWFHSLRGAGWCLAAGFLVSGSLPFIEATFGVVTGISLLELGDVSHPLLQELVRRAPGTYNHSITVASIGETAADAIGANGLLVRVGAYFHDIGKMLKPHYFVENMVVGAENRHDHLAPAMSTLIIIGHVKDGADLAEEHNLPQPLIDFIEQHHGTTLVAFFYHEAAKQADLQPDHRTDAEESNFRYPGPKPQTRESAVLMLADAVEGASRSLSEPTPKRIEGLVHDIAMNRLLDGQFDESGLTITELSTIEDSLTKSLIAMYHGRIKYPEQRTA